MTTSERLGVYGRAARAPRGGLLDLGGAADEQVFAAVGRHERNADGEAVGGPVERKRDRRLASDVERLCEAGEGGGAHAGVEWVGLRGAEVAEAWRGIGERRGQ